MPIQPTNTGPTSSTHAVAVTPSDTVDLTSLTKGIWVGSAGAMKVTMFSGEVVIFAAIPAGSYLPISVSRIWDADTDADDIVALWEG